ncbi:MAG: hypothetical protein ACE369_19120 [Roseovarius sp.]
MGLPFRIERFGGAVRPDDFVISYGQPLSPEQVGLVLPRGEGNSVAIGEEGCRLYGPKTSEGVDILDGAARLLGFEEEAVAPRDHLGRVIPETHPLALAGLLHEPLVDNAAKDLLGLVLRSGYRGPRPLPLFDGRRVVVLSHDVDSPRLHEAFSLARAGLLGVRNRLERKAFAIGVATMLSGRPDPYWNFDGWLDLIQGVGGHSTFFFYPGTVEGVPRHPRDPRYDPRRGRFPEALRSLIDAGADIGVHYGINTDSADDISKECHRLRELTGSHPLGGRAHYWRIDWSDPHAAWDRISAGGLSFDASLSPHRLGYRNGTMLPMIGGKFDVMSPAGRPFLVLPSPVMDSYVDPLHRDALDPASPDWFMRMASDGGLVILNWHVRTLSDVGRFKGVGSEARRLVLSASSDSNTVFCSAAEVAETWSDRIGRLWQPGD